ncbi:type II secretion system F family protein [Cohnella yongneupensis]|uniref:Type II secretion system F family protein n=1 Tax=Cohnella yongneupensis TaxID=425006 RepID=A0ABW0R1V0_9BACL
MPNFVYEAVNDNGKRIKGQHRATNKQTAIQELKMRGYAIRSVMEKDASVWSNDLNFGRAVKMEDFVSFCRQFATLVRAGIQIDRTVEILAEQTRSKKLKQSLEDVLENVRSGFQLSKAMAAHPKVFPEMFINMIESGEAGGHLDEVLDRMAEHYEKEHKTIAKVKSAMTYPIILTIIAIGVVIFLLVKIVPTFVSMFEDQGEKLPLITRIIMGASDFVLGQWWLLLIIVVGLVLLIKALTNNEKGKFYVDKLKFSIPIFGIVFKKSAIARMARTMSSLYTSGVNVLQSLEITSRVVGNRVLAQVLDNSRSSLQQGRQLSEPFAQSKQFPSMVIQMIIVGEETGQLDKMLGKVADFYEEDVDRSVDQLKAVVEPLMLLLVSVVVGVIVAAVITPMFTMYQNFLK